jgi:HD-GYP domain-containing protein (c-di-GMP phosphodiesterase class II)
MIKKIQVNQLKPGMFVHDLNCGWLQHPFMSTRFKVKNDKIVAKIHNYGIREVYIDTNKGTDVADAPTREEVVKQIDSEIDDIIKPQTDARNLVPVRQEMKRAREVKKEAKKTVENLMNEVRLGKQIEVEKVDHVVENMVESIFRNRDALSSLGRIKKVDEYTFMHSVSVGVLMISFGKFIGLDLALIKELGVGGLLHDVGKVKVPPELLASPEKLSDTEFLKVRDHVLHSRKILEDTPNMHKNSITVAAHHHERVDGSGYPDKLKGKNIHIFAQMAAIADVYDAMTSQRCYQRQFSPTETLKKLYEWDGAYNRELVQQFIRCVGIYPVGSLVRLQSGLIAVVMEHGEKGLIHPLVRVVYDAKKKTYVMPHDIDLSSNGSDSIAGYEVPEKCGIDPEKFI